MENSIAVIIVTYNGEKWIDKCIKPLYEIDNIKIVIVDNNSTDKTVDLIKEKYSKTCLIESKSNLGFGQANNKGFEYAIRNNFEYVFLLNQDASIDETNILKLVNEYSKFEDLGILSPVHFKDDINIENIFSSYLKENNINSDIIGDDKLVNMKFINAALWLISVENLKKIGGFNPTFFHYGEDVEFVNRMNFLEMKTFVLLNSKAYHFRDYNIKSVRANSSKKVHFGPWHIKYYILLSNINYSLFRCILLSFRLFVVSLIKHLAQLNFNSLKWDIKIFYDVMKNIRIVLKNRKISKNVIIPFLNV